MCFCGLLDACKQNEIQIASTRLEATSKARMRVQEGIRIGLYFLLLFHGSVESFQESGYIVTSPSVFRSNVNHVINVRIFNHVDAVRVNAKLVDPRENLIASVSSEIVNSGNLTIKVPPGLEGPASLKICGNCHLSDGFRFTNRTSVTLISKSSSAFIQTDKPVYKPGQTVYLNVFLVNRDLRPVHENVTVYVVLVELFRKASNEARIIQWRNLKPVCCGVINISFPLSDQPVLGKWTVFAEIQRNSFNVTFEIQKYVLPKFEVSITPPPFFRSNCEVIEVAAVYVFGKPVVGSLEVNMTVQGVDYSRTQFMDIGAPILRRMRINGRERFSVCMNQLLSDDVNHHFRGYLHIYAKVKGEDGSEFTAFDDSTPVSREKVDIEFTFDTRRHFKPGLPFVGKITSTYLDGSRAGRVAVHLTVNANREAFFHQDLLSSDDGMMTFTVPEVPDDTWFIVIKAKVVRVAGRQVGHHGSYITRYLHNWYSPSNCHVLAAGPGETLQVNKDAPVLVKSNCPCNFTLFYEILSRGNIVQSGSQVVLPSTSQQVTARSKPARRRSSMERLTASRNNLVTNHICEVTLPIHVTADMAPTSRMLVYYVRSNGEGVADSISLLVQPEFENEVEITTSNSETSPGSDVNVAVTSDPGSCVCLAVVDRSVHLMKPGYRISSSQIFNELRDYDLDNSPFQDSWVHAARAKRSGGHWWKPPQSRDAKHAFLESGLVVMTNVVSLNYKQITQVFNQLILQSMTQSLRSEEQSEKSKMNKVARRKRTFFPETWIWSCFNMSSGQQNFTVRVPDSVTTWQADAISLNPESGIGVSNPLKLPSVKNFFVDFNFPYSVIRGEQVQIPLTTYNYLNECVEASINVDLPNGVEFVDSDERSRNISVCVDSQTTKTISINLEFSILGHKRLGASIDAYTNSSICCGGGDGEKALVATDHVERGILVEAEGMKRNYAQSVYFCPNERINISTSSSRSYQFVRLPSNETAGFDFLVKAARSVHIVLAHEERVTNRSFEIVLGGEGNQRSWISKGSNRILRAHINRILSDDSFNPFWISWSGGNIQVGTGSNPSVTSQFMYAQQSDDETRSIKFIGFATSDGATGEFRLWQKQEANDQPYFQQLIALTLPANIVQHSARGSASLIGDVMGPTLKNLNNLLSLPFGCGEQNLANFAPNVYVLKYLKGTRQLTEQVRLQTIRYLQVGYQRQLTYKRHDSSYSAFGDKDAAGSMWLTSFVLKSFSQARQFIYIDPKELSDAKEWIVSWQQRSGAFPPVGKIWNKDIQSGVDGDVALTAYVTVALIEAGFEREEEEIAVMRAKEHLESHVHDDTDPYTASLTAYALTMLDSDFAQDARDRLYERAVHDEGDIYWSLRQKQESPLEDIFSFEQNPEPEIQSSETEVHSSEPEALSPEPESLFPEPEVVNPENPEVSEPFPLEQNDVNEALSLQDGLLDEGLPQEPNQLSEMGEGNTGLPPELAFILGDSLKQTVISAEVEMTGFALLTFTHVKNGTVALPIVRWLSQKRNAIGGFSSTQDTCVALQALSEYAVFSYIGGVNLEVSMGCTTDGTTNCSKEFILNNENDKVLQSSPIPQLPTEVFVNANGVGCALLQVDVSYNIPTFDGKPAFYIKVDYHRINNHVTSQSSMRQSDVVENDVSPVPTESRKYSMRACVHWLEHGSSNMAVLEFHLLTGFEADLESLEENNPSNLKRYEISGQIIFFYFDEVHSTCTTCVRFLATKKFETTTAKQRPVKIYDYYEPSYQSETMYPSEGGEYYNDQNDVVNDESDDVTEGELPECKCRHECGFSGPPVCGSNSVLYLNRCRLEAAACELEMQIEGRSKEFCEEFSTEKEIEYDDEGIELGEEEPAEEVFFHPALVSLGQYDGNELPLPESK